MRLDIFQTRILGGENLSGSGMVLLKLFDNQITPVTQQNKTKKAHVQAAIYFKISVLDSIFYFFKNF